MNRATEDRIAEHLANSVIVACDALPPEQGLRVLALVVAALADLMRQRAMAVLDDGE